MSVSQHPLTRRSGDGEEVVGVGAESGGVVGVASADGLGLVALIVVVDELGAGEASAGEVGCAEVPQARLERSVHVGLLARDGVGGVGVDLGRARDVVHDAAGQDLFLVVGIAAGHGGPGWCWGGLREGSKGQSEELELHCDVDWSRSGLMLWECG